MTTNEATPPLSHFSTRGQARFAGSGEETAPSSLVDPLRTKEAKKVTTNEATPLISQA